MRISWYLKIFDPFRLDERIYVRDDDAFEMARLLTIKEGIFCGISSGAVMHVTLQVTKNMDSGVVVTLFPDGGEKYISTPLFNPKKCFECIKKTKTPTCMTEKYIETIICPEEVDL